MAPGPPDAWRRNVEKTRERSIRCRTQPRPAADTAREFALRARGMQPNSVVAIHKGVPEFAIRTQDAKQAQVIQHRLGATESYRGKSSFARTTNG